MRTINQRTGKIIVEDLKTADSFFSRMKGLLGKTELPEGKGLLLTPCMGVHTFGMHFPIDVIFLDKKNHVIETMMLPPNRMSPLFFSASSVIELPVGAIEKSDTTKGDLISIA